MGRTISQKTYLKETAKEKSIVELDKVFQRYGYRYLGMYPNLLGNKPWLCKGKKPFMPIQQLGIREARAVIKKLEKEGKKRK